MLETLLSNEDFYGLMKKHVKEVLDVLLKSGTNFSILTSIADVTFEPELPSDISQNFKSITMFYLAGYTFESAQMYNGKLCFEAGFGTDNFGSLVSVPLESILQIIIEDVPVFINLSTAPKPTPKGLKEDGQKRSMSALMSNPENQRLLKK